MAPVEMSELKEIRTVLEDHVADFRVFKTKIMGDDESEDAQGRLPRIENTIRNHSERLSKLERLGWARGGVRRFVLDACLLVAAIYYAVALARHQ